MSLVVTSLRRRANASSAFDEGQQIGVELIGMCGV
jgi:hypothetical protein